MPKYLDENGLQTLWNKIVSKIGDAIPPVDSSLSSTSTNPVQNKVINSALGGKQSTLVSGTNIKTINNNSILGSGNLSITASVPT